MDGSHEHFSNMIAAEAMRMMDEEGLSLTQAYELAAARMAQVQGYEPPHPRDHIAVAEPGDSD